MTTDDQNPMSALTPAVTLSVKIKCKLELFPERFKIHNMSVYEIMDGSGFWYALTQSEKTANGRGTQARHCLAAIEDALKPAKPTLSVA